VIVAFVSSNLFTGGVVFLLAAALYYNAGRRDERAAQQRQRASSAAVRRRLAALAVKGATQPARHVPAAMQDKKHPAELRLRPIRKTASMGRN